MRYTTLGKTGLRVSVLGFGCMRLPMKDGLVDRALAIPLLHRAVELGVNLFDSATMYCGSDSENAVGEAFEKMRDKVVISTKNPLRGVTADVWRARLEESLKKLRTDHIDIYNHHGMNWGEFGKEFDPEKGGLTKAMLKAKEEGLIRHAAFSFHDSPEGLKKLADTGYYESVILQYNLLDQTNAEAISYAAGKGMGIIVMGPVGGGRLGLASERITELTGAGSTVEAALRFVWGHPAVNVALSGMQDLKMLEENVKLAETARPFTTGEIAQLNALVKERKEKSGMYCSGCRYCVPVCKAGIAIPEHLDMLNMKRVFGIDRGDQYRRAKTSVANCLDCGACVKACPQKIEIPARLREAAAMWDPRMGSVILTPTLEKVQLDGTVGMSLRVHNFAAQATGVGVKVEGINGTTLAPATGKAEKVEGFGRHVFRLSGKVDPEGSRMGLRATVTGHGKEAAVEAGFRYLAVPMGVREDWEGGVWHEFGPKQGDFAAEDATAKLHGVRFRLGWDEAGLVVHAEVADDFLYPSQEARDKGNYNVDSLELYVDGREGGRCGFSKYEKGVMQIFVYPGTPGEYKAFFAAREAIGLEVRSERTGRGYRLVIRVPFEGFCVGAGLPKRLGFDLAVNSADASGKRVGQYAFAGDKDNWNDASKFAAVWLG